MHLSFDIKFIIFVNLIPGNIGTLVRNTDILNGGLNYSTFRFSVDVVTERKINYQIKFINVTYLLKY